MGDFLRKNRIAVMFGTIFLVLIAAGVISSL